MSTNKTYKKLLTLDDLTKFCKSNQLQAFSSADSGYQLAVQIPSSFEIDENDSDDGLLMRVKMRLFHIGKNRNGSSVTREAAEKAMKCLAYKPILANFCETGEYDEDGNPIMDFTSHDMEITESGIKYIEKQIGCITADEPWWETDEETEKEYVCAYGAIPFEYSDACNILERKNGTKTSVEMLINEMRYSKAIEALELTDVMVHGETCLGINPETKAEVGEGMIGSRADIADFSSENNSIISNYTQISSKNKLVDTLERLTTTLEKFNIDKNYGKEAIENGMEDEIKVNAEVTEAEKVVVTETESTEEEVTETTTENESEETVEVEAPEVVEHESKEDEKDPVVETESEDEGKPVDTEAEETEEETDETEVTEEAACGGKKKKYAVEFELSHDDVRNAIYQLLSPYCEADNEWYWVVEVFDDRFVYQGCAGNFYGQKYVKDGDAVAFDGERYELYAEFVTSSEKAELEAMRSNYSAIAAKLDTYEKAELLAQKEEIFADANYAEFIETEGFKEIKGKIDTYSVDELRTACDLQFAKEIKAKGTFAAQTEKPVEKKATFFAFAESTPNSSFLDGLLKK